MEEVGDILMEYYEKDHKERMIFILTRENGDLKNIVIIKTIRASITKQPM
jgi:hypothetical protein